MSFMSSMMSSGGGGAGGGGGGGGMWEQMVAQGAQTTGQILGSYNTYQQAKQAQRYYSANSRNTMLEAKNNAAYQREMYSRLASSQRAAYGASGVDVNVGSPLDVVADTDAQGEVAAMMALYAGEMEKTNWEIRRKSAKRQAGNALLGMITGIADPMDIFKTSKFNSGYYQSGGGLTLKDM